MVAVVEHAPLGEDGPARRAGTTLLRGDDDDAVCRIRSIERSGRGSLHDLDVLDLLWIDVTNAAEVAPAVSERRRAVVRAHTDSVNDVDRIVGQANAADAAHSNALARARLAAALYHDAWHARVQHVAHVTDR